jgi:prolipoprotein diacylglyceryltransferase
MSDWITIEIGLGLIALAALPILLWSFRNLPQERWQFAAILPSPDRQQAGHGWVGTNITFYGVISALAYAAASAMFIFLCGSVEQPVWATLVFIVALLAACIPASKLIANWVEGGNVNFTVGGAVFAGALLLPVAVYLARLVAQALGAVHFNATALLAAAGLAYVLGEAIGRLGCLSFGCCYGRPISEVGPMERALYGSTATTYRGQLKKISYASNMENTPVVPVQSIASVVLFALFLVGLWLFWQQRFVACALLSVWGSQLWRLYSETLRADYRGGGKISTYQWMAIATCIIATFSITASTGDASTQPRFALGWSTVSQLEVFIAVQALALGIVWFMGRSQVTGALVNLRLFRERL